MFSSLSEQQQKFAGFVALGIVSFLFAKMVRPAPLNPNIAKNKSKVVHVCDFADIEDGGKKSFCRCWRSKKFPYCDGAHNEWNALTGDNTGPITVKRG